LRSWGNSLAGSTAASAASWPPADPDGDYVDLRDLFGPEDNRGAWKKEL